MSVERHYAGIGSRETPLDVMALMTKIARWLDRRDYVLRSGGADGADTAFAEGSTHKKIFLPWGGFNGLQGSPTILRDVQERAAIIAANFHPAWDCCSPAARKLHTRNVYQVLGADLKTPSRFVVCWTKDGEASGGTGQALRIAEASRIPIFNLFDASAAERLHAYVA